MNEVDAQVEEHDSDSEAAGSPGQPRPLEVLKSLPNEVWIVLAIDFLNSYRSFGFRSVQYQYLTK